MPLNTSCARSLLCHLLVVVALVACGGSSTAPADSHSPAETGTGGAGPPNVDQPEAATGFAYVRDGPYADVLWECTAAWVFQPCSFERLPLIGQETNNPQVDDIMNRVLVTHDWMGQNFRRVLERLPGDALLLFRSTTGIVISDGFTGNVFFLGKVYLDPVFLWLTPEQRDDISSAPRGTPASDGLGFRMPWRYVRDGRPLRFTGPDSGPRSEDEIVFAAAALLFHELAHAVDWMPVSEIGNQALPEDVLNNRLALAWEENHPIRPGVALMDLPIHKLAQIRFGIGVATPGQLTIQPEELIVPFADEGAVRFYSYIDVAEDFATAYETAMMAFHFDYHQETGITGNTADSANDEIVVWGQRGRIGEQQVYTRVLGAVQAIYPGDLAAVESFLAAQPPATQMQTGITWGESAGSAQ